MSLGEDLLRLYVAGALEPTEAARVDAWLRADPSLVARVEALAEEELGLPPRSAWRLPPPGLGLALDASRPGSMGPRQVRVGDTVQLELPVQPDPTSLQVVVLRSLPLAPGGDWQVLAPAGPAEQRTLDRLPATADGGRRLSLVAPGPAGLQRLAVVLAPADLALDWSLPADQRWAGLLESLGRRLLPAGTVELQVAES